MPTLPPIQGRNWHDPWSICGNAPQIALSNSNTTQHAPSTLPRDAPRSLAYLASRRGQSGPAAARGEKDRNGIGPGPQGPHRAASRGTKVLADALVAQGIDHVFEVPGESFLDTLDGLYDNGGRIKLVTCRFEAGAVNMADAYGKLTGRPAAAMVTRGPGACHGAIGVHVAYQDSTPMLLFVGQIPHQDTGRDAFQEVDYRQMFAPLAKWVTQIDYAKRIPEVVAHAVDVATSGRPGPVVIALSEEMQKDQVEVARPAARQRSAPPSPTPTRCCKCARCWRKPKKPVAVVGGSCWTARAGRRMHRFPGARTTSR